MFSITSRYQGIPTSVHKFADGREVTFAQRRFVPHPEELARIGEHEVVPGERPDLIAAKEFGDPELFWRLADANRVLDPDELVAKPGRRLRVTLPAGIPGGGLVNG